MSFNPDDPEYDSEISTLLQLILAQLKLLNDRFEEANETGLTEEDIE